MAKKAALGSKVTTKEGEEIRVFEDLEGFELFLKTTVDENDFDRIHAQASYYPPFVLHGSHDDPEKIKETENSHNKKFVRHLHQHIEKHLLVDIQDALKHHGVKFTDKHKDEQPDKITWTYGEVLEVKGRKIRVDVVVSCHSEDAMVFIDYRTSPAADEE